jgi:hypothetical protein
MGIRYYTYWDAVRELMDYCGSQAQADVVLRDCKRSVLDCLRELNSEHRWTQYYTLGRIQLNASVDTGQVTGTAATAYPSFSYDFTGGAYERLATMDAPPAGSGQSQAVWPSWVADGWLKMGNVIYRVDQRISDTQITFTSTLCPQADLATGTTWSALYQDTYLLPDDYISQDQALYEDNFGGMTYTHIRDWLQNVRYTLQAGQPWNYSICGSDRYSGRLVIRIFPFPNIVKTIDFIYQRIPRALKNYDYEDGRVALTSGSSLATGTATAWTQDMVGTVFRLSGNALTPTGEDGDNPATFETIVQSVTSATSLVLTDPAPSTVTNKVYIISDPIDINLKVMLTVFKRGCERQMGIKRVFQDKPSANRLYQEALTIAKGADSVSFTGRIAGEAHRFGIRLARQPWGDTGGNVYDAPNQG